MRLLITSYVMLIKYLLIAIIHTYIHKNISKNGNGNGIYIPHFLYVYIQMRFTCVRVRSDISIYRRRRQPLSVHWRPHPTHPSHES